MSNSLPALKNLNIVNPRFLSHPSKAASTFHQIHLPSSSLDTLSISWTKNPLAILKKACVKVNNDRGVQVFRTESFLDLRSTNTTYFNNSSKETDVMSLDIVCKKLKNFRSKENLV